MADKFGDKTVIGVFDSFRDVERVLLELTDQGVAQESISLLTPDEAKRPSRSQLHGGQAHEFHAQRGDLPGATPHHPHEYDPITNRVGAGAMIGGLSGFLLTFASFLIPGVGAVLATGPLITALGGASLGGAIGGLAGAFSSAGVAHEDALFYAEALRRGATIVTVNTEEKNAMRIVRLFRRFSAIDIDERAAQYRRHGIERFNDQLPPLSREELREQQKRFSSVTAVDRVTDTMDWAGDRAARRSDGHSSGVRAAEKTPLKTESEKGISPGPIRRPVLTGGVRVVNDLRPGSRKQHPDTTISRY